MRTECRIWSLDLEVPGLKCDFSPGRLPHLQMLFYPVPFCVFSVPSSFLVLSHC